MRLLHTMLRVLQKISMNCPYTNQSIAFFAKNKHSLHNPHHFTNLHDVKISLNPHSKISHFQAA